MNELARPFVEAWNWAERVGGFPGQVLFVVLIVILVFAGFTWYGNRR